MEKLLEMAGPDTLAPPPFSLDTPSPPPASASPGQKLSTILETTEHSRVTGASRLFARQTSRAMSNGSDWPGFNPGLGRSFTFHGEDVSSSRAHTLERGIDRQSREQEKCHNLADHSMDTSFHSDEHKSHTRSLRPSSSTCRKDEPGSRDWEEESGDFLTSWAHAQRTPKRSSSSRGHCESPRFREGMGTHEAAILLPSADERHRTPLNFHTPRTYQTPKFTRVKTDPDAIGDPHRPPAPDTPYWTPMGGPRSGSRMRGEEQGEREEGEDDDEGTEGLSFRINRSRSAQSRYSPMHTIHATDQEEERRRGSWVDETQSPSIFRYRRNSLGSFGASTDSEEQEQEEEEKEKLELNARSRSEKERWKAHGMYEDEVEESDQAIPAPSVLSASSMYFPQDQWSEDEEEMEPDGQQNEGSSVPPSPSHRRQGKSDEVFHSNGRPHFSL